MVSWKRGAMYGFGFECFLKKPWSESFLAVVNSALQDDNLGFDSLIFSLAA